MQLVINDLLLSKLNSYKIERVVWIDHENGWCYMVNTKEPSFPYRLETNYIQELLEKGEIEKIHEDPWYMMVQEDDLTESEIKKRDFAWRIIEDVYQTPDIFDAKSRSKLIKRASDKFKVSQKTIRKYLKQYWSRGILSKNSLLPNFCNSGKKQVGERVYTKKTGRPPVYSSSIKRGVVGEEWKRVFRVNLEKHYFKRSKPSLKYAYQQMLKDYFSVDNKELSYKVLNVNEPIPSFDQFYYFYRRNYKPDYVVRKREGRRAYLQNYRAITGSPTEDSMGIGLYAVDGTIGDIYLVSSIDKNKIISRPTIYLVVDIFSRYIVGLYVGIDNMSGESLRIALANTFENKQEFCKRTLDMEIGEEDWIAHYLPHTLLADRGSELISDSLSSLVENLNIKIQNTAPFRPELKGICEQFFHILQNNMKSFSFPGWVQKDANSRGVPDYRKGAILNLKEYSRILVRCILYYNNKHYLSDYPLTKNMLEEKVPPIPIEIFKWGLQKGTGLLRAVSPQTIIGVYPIGEGIVTAKGIYFSGLYYSSPTAVKEKWFSTARIKGNWKISVQYNPQNISQIYLRLNRMSYEVCLLIEQYEMYRSARLEEVIDLSRSKRQQEADYHEKELNGQIQLAQEIEEIVKQAKIDAKVQSIDGNSRKNVKDIRQNRKEEQELLRKTSHPELISYAKDESSNFTLKSPKREKSMELFRQKQKEGLGYEND
jgi:hypothetical protein